MDLWSVIHVQTSRESWIAMQLQRQSWFNNETPIDVYVPTYATTRKHGDHKPEPVRRALFAGYLFAHGPGLSVVASKTQGCISILPQPVTDEEMEHVRELEASPGVKPAEFTVGQLVRVRGKHATLEGTLVQLCGELRMVVAVPMLGRAVSIRVDRDMVEAA